MKRIASFYSPRLPVSLVYMLQQVEYDPGSLLRWILRFPNLSSVMNRQSLIRTKKASILVTFASILLLFCIFIGLVLLVSGNIFIGLIIVLTAPYLTVGLFYLAMLMAWMLIEQPGRKKELAVAQAIFDKHPGFKIAIAGSYGKTTMKELLLAVLGTEKKIAATPGNKNVVISHARWANKLAGDEDILLIEYGEGAPGDIARFARLSKPNMAIITGLAPNHLDRYKSLQAVANDLLSITAYIPSEQIFINTDDLGLASNASSDVQSYSHKSVMGWQISNIKVDYSGTSFVMRKGGKKLVLDSLLLGQHQVGPLALAAALALHFGVSGSSVKRALKEIEPYEHRMYPRRQGGAWIIDDTYNGNLEGMKAGLQLLKDLPAKRKIYVTPGVVDQGEETERVHREIGVAIAKAAPDKVILMQNSATSYIEHGLTAAGYAGSLEFRDDPLNFYTHMDQYIASGDLWLLQNDWTDNYF